MKTTKQNRRTQQKNIAINIIHFLYRFGSVCPQRLPNIANETAALERMPRGRLEYLKRLIPHLKNQSEDCLYLNIYVPIQGKWSVCFPLLYPEIRIVFSLVWLGLAAQLKGKFMFEWCEKGKIEIGCCLTATIFKRDLNFPIFFVIYLLLSRGGVRQINRILFGTLEKGIYVILVSISGRLRFKGYSEGFHDFQFTILRS